MPERVPAGADATDVQPGDFLLLHRPGFISWAIRLGERLRLRKAEVSHAAFCETPDSLIEALTRGVVRSPLSTYRHTEYWIVRAGLTGDDQEQAVAFARSCLGRRYGFLTDFGIALRFLTPGRGLWFGMTGTEICSGLCAQAQVRGWALYDVNPSSISPQELFDAYQTSTTALAPPSSSTGGSMSSFLSRLSALFFKIVPTPLQGIVKAIVAAIVPLVSVSLLNGSFDYKAIIAAAITAIAVYISPNKAKAPAK